MEEEKKEKPSRVGTFLMATKFVPKILSLLFKSKIFLAAASFAIYADLFTWKFAPILMGSLFFHELGHVRAMRAFGVPVKGIYFLPFMGAAAVSTGAAPSRKADAYIALWGPLWGFALALAVFDIYVWTGSQYAAVVAAWMAAVNLFNLLPIWPLDGGRLMAAVARSAGTNAGFVVMGLGCAGTFGAMLSLGMPLFAFFLLVGMLELWGDFRTARKENDRRRLVAAFARMFAVENTGSAVVEELARRHALACTGDFAALRDSCVEADEAHTAALTAFQAEPDGFSKWVAVDALFRQMIFGESLRQCGERNVVATFRHLFSKGDPPFSQWLEEGKNKVEPMAARQSFVAMAGYAALVIALTGILYMAKVNDVAGAASELFRS